MRSVYRRLPSPKPTQKRFGSIPLDSRKISRNQLGALVGRMIGGSYKNAKRPWESRRVVRDILKKTGHLDTIKQKTKYQEKDVVQMLKDFRAELKNRRQAQGYGVLEQGEYFGKKEKDVYRKFVEETYNQSQALSVDEQRQRALEIRIIKARRRELQREALGLAPISVANKLTESRTKAEVDRSEARRANLEQRLETIIGGAVLPSGTAQPVRGARKKDDEVRPAGKNQQKTNIPVPNAPRKGLATITPLFAAAVHLPPRHGEIASGGDEAQTDQPGGEEGQAPPSLEEKIIPIEKIRAIKKENTAAEAEPIPKEPDDGQLFAA